VHLVIQKQVIFFSLKFSFLFTGLDCKKKNVALVKFVVQKFWCVLNAIMQSLSWEAESGVLDHEKNMQAVAGCALYQWYSTFFVRVPPDIISLQLCTSRVGI
jgi:hypothetical protein